MKLRSQVYKFLDPIYQKYLTNLTINLFKFLKKGPSRLVDASSLPKSEDFAISYLPDTYKIEQPFPIPFCLPEEIDLENRLKQYQRFADIAKTTEHKIAIVSLKNVLIEFPSNLHIWQGKVIRDVTTHIRAFFLRNLEDLYLMLKLESILGSKKTKIEQECIFILGSFPGNYWHWLVQILPKMRIFDQDPTLKDLPILLPKDLQPFCKETLEIAGYLDRVIFLENGVYQIDKLHVCNSLFTKHPDITYAETVEWLREKLPKQENFTEKKRRIYISRKDARSRQITNESELEPILEKYGFEIIALTDFSVEQKIKFFQQAEIIIGIFGAGMSNLVFATPGSVVIEIFPENMIKQTYYVISVLLNLKYGFLVGNQDGNGLYVEPEKMEKIIEESLSRLNTVTTST
ncbi:MAG: glycosyltransferase family 61 protein [Gloeocapsa sp. DLM2.Bin57]|nr:MAG: glycosyltransferase family 61 protein [Gloeocapsa sp. DLM2.Bin57]